MEEKYIDVILENLKKKLLRLPDAECGLPERISYVIQYKNSVVVNGFYVHFTDNEK